MATEHEHSEADGRQEAQDPLLDDNLVAKRRRRPAFHSIFALFCISFAVIAPLGWRQHLKSSQRYLMLLPAEGESLRMSVSIAIG